MKKISLAILALTTSAVMAEQVGKPAQGFYLGASGGLGATQGKSKVGSVGSDPAFTFSKEAKYSANGFMAGLIAGYNRQFNNFVLGLDLYGGADTTKEDVFNTIPSSDGNLFGYYAKLSLKKKAYFGFAPRAGFMVTPSTLLYVKVGAEMGKWEYTITPDAAQINAFTTATAVQKAASAKTVTTSSSKLRLAPGLGLEMYKGKMLFRMEYTYLAGPTIKASQDYSAWRTEETNDVLATFMNHEAKITQHQIKLGVAYKF